jgi:hypothetical protein
MFISARSITTFQNDAIDIVNGVSVLPVTGVASTVSRGTLIERGTDALLYSNFAYTGTATTITARLQVTRLARVQDRIIQLSNGTQLIGVNQARLDAEDDQLYVFTGNFTVNPSFGIVIDLGPHTQYPSSTTIYIRDLSLEFA